MCIIQNISVKLLLNRNNWCQHYLPSSMTTSTYLHVVSPYYIQYMSTVYLYLPILHTVHVYSVPLSPHTTYMYSTCLQCTSISPYYIHVHVYSVPLSPHTTVHVYSVPLSPHTTVYIHVQYMSTVYLYLPILHTCTCLQCTSISPYYSVHTCTVHVYSVPLSPHTTVHVYSVPLSPHTTVYIHVQYMSTVYLYLPILHTVHVYSVPLSPHTTVYIHVQYMSTVYLYLPILHTVHVYSVPLSPHTTVHVYSVPLSRHTICTCSIVLVQCTYVQYLEGIPVLSKFPSFPLSVLLFALFLLLQANTDVRHMHVQQSDT